MTSRRKAGRRRLAGVVVLLSAAACGGATETSVTEGDTATSEASEVVVLPPPGYELQFAEAEMDERGSLEARCSVSPQGGGVAATVWLYPSDPRAGELDDALDVVADDGALTLGGGDGRAAARFGDRFLEAQEWTDDLPEVSLGEVGAAIERSLSEDAPVGLGERLTLDCERVDESDKGAATLATGYRFRPVSDRNLPQVHAVVRPRISERTSGETGPLGLVSIERGEWMVELLSLEESTRVPEEFELAIREVTPEEKAELWRSGTLGALLDVGVARGVAFELTGGLSGKVGMTAIDGGDRHGIGGIDAEGEGWTSTDVPIAGLGGLTWAFVPSPLPLEGCSMELTSGEEVEGEVEPLDLDTEGTRIYACVATVRVPEVVHVEMRRPGAAPLELDFGAADDGP